MRIHPFAIGPVGDYYVNVTPLDGDMKKVNVVDDRDDGGVRASILMGLSGVPLDPEFVPTKVKWGGRGRQKIPDFQSSHFFNVSARTKEIIESFEPDRHQFLPVDFYRGTGELIERRWFFIVCNRIDAVDRDHTTGYYLQRLWLPWADLARSGDPVPPGVDIYEKAEFVFSKEAIGSAKFFSDKHLNVNPLMTDDVAQAFQDAGLTGIVFRDGWRAV